MITRAGKGEGGMLVRTGKAKPSPCPANTNQSSPATSTRATAPILRAPWQTRLGLELGRDSGGSAGDNILFAGARMCLRREGGTQGGF